MSYVYSVTITVTSTIDRSYKRTYRTTASRNRTPEQIRKWAKRKYGGLWVEIEVVLS